MPRGCARGDKVRTTGRQTTLRPGVGPASSTLFKPPLKNMKSFQTGFKPEADQFSGH